MSTKDFKKVIKKIISHVVINLTDLQVKSAPRHSVTLEHIFKNLNLPGESPGTKIFSVELVKNLGPLYIEP